MSQILPNKKPTNSSIANKPIFETCHSGENDIFYIFIKAIKIIDTFFNFLFSIILFLIQITFSKKYIIIPKMCFYSIFVTFLFSISQSPNIPRELIMKAYFNKSKVVHISYDNIIQSTRIMYDNKAKKNNEANYEEKYNYYNDNHNLCCNDDTIYDDIDNDEEDQEFSLFNFFQVKKIFVTFIAFFLLYIIIKITYLSKITNSIVINLIGDYFSFKIMSFLYSSQYYLASGFIFILFFYFYKFTIDSFYFLLKFKKSDYEIFSAQLSAETLVQFWLKFINLFFGTILSGVLSIIYFNLYFNYIAFYMCLFTLIIFLFNCLEKNYFIDFKY